MKNKLTFLLATLFLLTLSPQVEAAKDYCGETVTLDGVSCTVTFEKISGTINSTSYSYRATFVAPSGTKLYKYPHSSPSGYIGVEGDGSNNLIFYFSSKPTDTSNIGWVCVNGTSSPSYLYLYSPNDINWDASCGPVLAITSAEVASKTSSEIVLNVTSTEATKYKVVCSQFTRELTVSSGTAASGQITLSGLSASTTYNLTIYAMDDAGNTSSSSISLSETTDAPPAETTPPTINSLSSTLTGDGYSTANITVNATDNVGVTRVVIKNGSTTLLDQGVTSTTSLNQAFAVSGLPIGATTTLTVIVYDAAGNNASETIDVKTNAPNPQMTSASVASTTQNSVTLNVASTGGNGYKVTYGGNTITTTASNGQITITGLNSGTTYNFTVYAMYDTYQSSNSITVKAKTVEVGCSGTSTTCTSGGSEFVSYKINYIGGNILFTVKSTTANQLTSCKLNYATNTSGANAVSGLPMTITNGEATYTLPATGNIASGTLYFSFTYKTGGMGSEGSTTSGWNSAFQYPIGGCALDDGMPYMQSATKAGATTSSITLDVSAVVNIDGVASSTAVTQYNVSVDGAAAQTLTATNGQITVTGLSANTSYNFEVWALYNGNQSENSKTLTASTNKESECWGTRGHYDYTPEQQTASPRINFEIAYNAGTITMTFEDADGVALDFLQIEWNIPGIASRTVNTSNDVTLSEGKATYNLVADDAWIGNPMGILILYSNTNMGGNLQTSNSNNPETGNGVIYYVVGECGAEDTEDPKINAFVPKTGNTTADVHVVASDDTGITQIIIKDENGTPVLTETIKRLTTLDATYTITGLNKNTTYSGYTVTVIDRADKSVKVTLPNFTTTNTPEPTILSAAVDGEIKSSSVVLAVTSEQANQYKVVEKDGKFADQILTVTSGTPDNGKITITGLKGRTDYTVYVYAMYDNTESVNFIELTFTTPVGSECSGTRGSHTGDMTNAFDFLIDFDGENILFEFISKVDFDYLEMNWICEDGSKHDITNTNGIVIDSSNKKRATYTYKVSDALVGKAIGIRLVYSNTNMGGNEQTSLNIALDDPNIIYYKVGECGCEANDGDIPTLVNATLAYTTPNSAVINVSATDPSSVVTTYEVETKQGGSQVSKRDYYATDGQITISGLTSCETYTFIVKAKDPSCNISNNSIEITAAKTTQNHVRQTGVTANYVKNTAPGDLSIDGLLNTRGGSQDERNDITIAEALNNSIFTVDLGTVRVISEIDIFWERACATDYELQASIDGNYWSTIRRYTDMPVWAFYAPIHGDSNMVYRFDEMPARYLRVKPNMLYVAAKWGMSIWEFEAYGPCDVTEMQCPVVLDVRAESIRAQSAVISVSGIDQQTVNPAELTYIVTTSTDVPGRRTITNTYTFTPTDAKREDSDGKAFLTLDGLVPGTFYTISVTAKDPDKNESCNYNYTTLRTGKAEGCTAVFEGNSVIQEGDWKAFPSGMTYRLELQNNNEGTEFTATISFKGKPADMTISSVYFAIRKQATGADCYAGWVEQAMERDGDIFTKTYTKDATYDRNYQDGCDESSGQTYTYPLFTDWPNIELYFKMETSSGIIHTNYFEYNPAEKACEEFFIIFHEGSEPAEDMSTYYTGNTIPHEIFYYRLINPGEWTPLCLPFVVDKVEIFDPEDKKYYSLAAATDTKDGNYWIRQQRPNVSGELFKESWFNGTETTPLKGVPYNLTVPTGGYYDNKYLVFHGAAGQTVETEFKLGEASTTDDQYNLFGNNTMQPQLMTKAYKEDDDGKYYRLQENWTLNPFECYVLASAETMKRMPIIGRWNDEEEATSIDEVKAEMPLDEIHVYTTLGQHVTTLYQCSLRDAEMHIAQTMTAGCYIILGPQVKTKLLIP